MVRADVEQREMISDHLIVGENLCLALNPWAPRPRVAEWFVALVASKVIVLALFSLGVGYICFAVSRREVEQNDFRGLEPPGKTGGQTIQFEAVFFRVHPVEN